jgi:hygromycin-B 4-O-kinase
MTTLAPMLPDAALRDLLAAALPGWAGEMTPLQGGGTARVYTLEHAGVPLVLRLSALSESFAKDAHAAAHFAGPGLPIPAVLAWGQAAEGVWYALTRRAPGATLNALAPERQRALAPAVLHVLDAIHAIDVSATSGYGYWSPAGSGRWPSWAAFLQSVADEEPEGPFQGWTKLFDDGRLDRVGFTTIYEALVALSAGTTTERTLVHGDLGFDNILADDQGLTAVLDWANAKYGDPLYDLAWLSFWPSPVDWLALWRQRPEARWDADAERRVVCCWCFHALIAMRFFAVTGQPQVGDWVRDQMLARLQSARARGLLTG